jgi:hypothetical protein
MIQAFEKQKFLPLWKYYVYGNAWPKPLHYKVSVAGRQPVSGNSNLLINSHATRREIALYLNRQHFIHLGGFSTLQTGISIYLIWPDFPKKRIIRIKFPYRVKNNYSARV